MFDLPKNVEWILNKYITKGKAEYEFEIWDNNPTQLIAEFKTKNPKAMVNKIKKLVIKLNK